MLVFYLSLTTLVSLALGLLAFALYQSRYMHWHRTFVVSALATLGISWVCYSCFGNSNGLKGWLTTGKSHYELMVAYQRLGGIDGIIKRIKQHLNQNPTDAKGWHILAMLYRANHQERLADEALQRAKALGDPEPYSGMIFQGGIKNGRTAQDP